MLITRCANDDIQFLEFTIDCFDPATLDLFYPRRDKIDLNPHAHIRSGFGTFAWQTADHSHSLRRGPPDTLVLVLLGDTPRQN